MIMYICVYCITQVATYIRTCFYTLASHDYLAQHFTEGCLKICTEAFKFLCDIAEKLKQGKVTVQELELLTSHMTQTVNLFSPKIAVQNDPAFSIKDIITQRNSEVQKFQSYCSTVRILLEHCENIADGMYLCIYIIIPFSGKFGIEFDLVVWQILTKLPNLISYILCMKH